MEDLNELAEAVGVIGSWRSDRGEPVEASVDAIERTLALLGQDPTGPGGARAALAQWRDRKAAQFSEPVQVAWEGRFVLAAPNAGGRPVTCWVETEGGSVIAAAPGTLVETGFGVHRLVMDGSDSREVATIIAAPRVPWRAEMGRERRFGLFAPLYALGAGGGRPIGDLSDLADLFVWLDRRGGDVVVTLPLLAAWSEPGRDPSPYSPVSRRAWNELYLDLNRLPCIQGHHRMISHSERNAVELAPAGDLVDYDAAWAMRRPLLAAAADSFFAAGGSRHPDFVSFLSDHPHITSYARFRGACEHLGTRWQLWPAAARGGQLRDADISASVERFHRYVQWAAHCQFGELAASVEARGQLLALDLALGAHPDGFDVWDRQDLFVAGASVGAPPDHFFSRGQDWGFPPLHPERSRLDGHQYFRDCLTHHLAHAGLLRIDHVMGLHRLYWVGAGAGPRHGCYVRNAQEELLASVCLEAWRRNAIVVGENLGTVPPAIDEALAQHELLGTYVLSAEAWGVRTGGVRPAPRNSVATWGTHDMPSFAGFWQDLDVVGRTELGLLTAEESDVERSERDALREDLRTRWELPASAAAASAYRCAVAELAASDAALVVISADDLWLNPHPHNVPGTVSERPNWRRRFPLPLADWDDNPQLLAVLSDLAESRPRPEPS